MKEEDAEKTKVLRKKTADLKDRFNDKPTRTEIIFSEEQRTTESRRKKEYSRKRKEVEKVKEVI